MPDSSSPPRIQRCTYTEDRGGIMWQCRLPDPHPDALAHDLPPDAEFGKVLHQQSPEWLAAVLRDRVAAQRNMQRRLERLQAVAMDLASSWAGGFPPHERTQEWLRVNAPTSADLMGIPR